MKTPSQKIRVFAAVALLVAAVPSLWPLRAEKAEQSAAATKPVELFNGKDLSGWTSFPEPTPESPSIWSVRDGVLVCLGKPKGYLRTTASYENYRLRLQWRWPEKPGNSGVFLHGSGAEKIWPQCYEAQLAANNAGELRANGGSLFLAGGKPKDKSRPKLAASSERAPGEWNHYGIVCHGGSITLLVNGVRQNLVENTMLTSGWIALQSEGGVIEFRAIVLERL